MNDDTLTIALGRMAEAIEPPAAAERLIETRRARIRGRRHLTTGLVAAGVLAIAATGGAVASAIGDRGPDSSTPASAATAPATASATAKGNAAPACPGGERIWSLADLISLSQEVPEAGSLLSLDLESKPPRAWVISPERGAPVLELLLEKKGERFEVASATRCPD